MPHIPEVLLFRKHQLRKMGPSKPKPPTAGPPSPKLPPPPPVKKPAPKTPTKAPPKVSWERNSWRTRNLSLKLDNLIVSASSLSSYITLHRVQVLRVELRSLQLRCVCVFVCVYALQNCNHYFTSSSLAIHFFLTPSSLIPSSLTPPSLTPPSLTPPSHLRRSPLPLGSRCSQRRRCSWDRRYIPCYCSRPSPPSCQSP